MFTPDFRITQTMLTNVEQLGRVMGFLQAVQLPGPYAQQLLAALEAEIVHASTAIEGNTLTQQQVTEVLRGRAVHALRRDIQEVRNYQAALAYVHEFAAQGLEFTHQTVLELHYRLLQDVDDEVAGRYRTGFVRVGDYFPPEPFAVHALMNDFVAWLNNPHPPGYSPLLYAGIAHYQFVAIHPFRDGNGRTARALTTLYLLRHGYDITRLFALESHYNRDRAAYYTALHTVDSALTPDGERDFTPWLEYFVGGLLIEALRAESRVRTYLREAGQTPPPSLRLTATQHAILQRAARQPWLATSDLAAELNLSRRGIAKAVSQLVAGGLLARQGATRGAVYQITEAGLAALSGG